MQFVLLLCIVAGLGAAEEDKYTTKYDNVDVMEILNNARLYEKYIQCIKGEGKCTEDAKLLRDVIPDALQTECKKCSDKQKAGADKVIKFLVENKPEDFKALEEKFDPEKKYRKKYNEEAKKRGIKLIE